MLTAEEARDRLQQQATPDGAEAQIRRVARLWGPAGNAGRALLGYRMPAALRTTHSPDEVGELVDALAPRRRAKLFRALHPALAETFEAAWEDLTRDPFTLGYGRRAFRAPGHAEVSRAARASWLSNVCATTAVYEHPPQWFAAWAAHLDGGTPWLGRMLGVAIDHGQREVFSVLLATLRGEHGIGQMGRHVPTALLSSADPDGWGEVERLLLAAQRQEGLRQVILETVDLAHPAAFRRMLRLIVEKGLTRFAATIRAVSVWLGEGFDVRDQRVVDDLLGELVRYLEDPAAAEAAFGGEDPGRIYLGLWALAFEDAVRAADRAAALLRDTSADRRLAAARLLSALQLPAAVAALTGALTDEDPRVAAVAFQTVQRAPGRTAGAAFEPLHALLERLDADRSVQAGLWKPLELPLSPADVADALVFHLGERPPTAVADVVARMSPVGRDRYARALAEHPGTYRAELLALTGDRAETVRHRVFAVLDNGPPPDADEAEQLEELLRRKNPDLRRAVIGLLLRQPDNRAAASALRLLDGTEQQKSAGQELLRELRSAGRASGLPDLDAAPPPQPVPTASPVAEAAAAGASSTPGQDDQVRSPAELVDQAARTPAVGPSTPHGDLQRWNDGIGRVLRSLDGWLAEHRDVEVTLQSWHGPRVELVSNLRWLPVPLDTLGWEAQKDHFPLPELVGPWWERVAPQLTAGGLEALLAWPAAEAAGALVPPPHLAGLDVASQLPSWLVKLVQRTSPPGLVPSLQYAPVAVGFLRWIAVRELRPKWIDPLLDATEAVLAAVPANAIRSLPTIRELVDQRWKGRGTAFDWRNASIGAWPQTAVTVEGLRPECWSRHQRARLWRLVRFFDEPQGLFVPSSGARDRLEGTLASAYGPSGEVPRRPARRRPPLRLTIRAIEDGTATPADLVELLVGERAPDDDVGPGHRREPDALAELTRRRRPAWAGEHPWLGDLVDGVGRQILDTEVARGELPTPATAAALRLRGVVGAEMVCRLLAGLGSQSLVRGYIWRGDSKPEVFSKLIRVSFPAEDDRPEDFAAVANRHRLDQKRLLGLAVYAPQWAPFVEAAVGWEGLTDAIHWLHAHTKDDRWQVDEDVRSEWTTETHQRTPLSAEDLVNGAVDVAWFERVRAALGDARFDTLLKVAKYASSSGGHKRAELFARALRGQLDRDELLQRIGDKRHQDAVRALGLLPLPDEEDARRGEVLDRYQRLQAWKKAGTGGQQRRASESLAVRIAFENLARTAGYRDPQRLQWAMEAEAVRDLAAGPVTVAADGVTVSLAITPEGAPDLVIRRADRVLKSLPKELRDDDGVATLKQRANDLREQGRRMRRSLEEAAVRGDRFTPQEFAELTQHPVLAPMLETLVVVTDEGLLGWPRDAGRMLLPHNATQRPADGSSLRLAHPADLLESGEWHDWQHACFERRVRQPFKQVFRELYVLTSAERGGARRSERYAGHQVQPRQATALFGSRGWIVDREAGALRTFHDEGMTVHVEALGLWGTPGEVEDLTIDAVAFTTVGSWQPLPLVEVPPRLFSEAMRDVDLVVSVAHAGGVDPEASASTVEMRGALVNETAQLLALDNVELTDHHALIRGRLGSYSVHLGSGIVHRRPGNAVCIVPVGAQHRGRIFLPFMDDDPRTAEVVSKVVTLARDDQIHDPTILEQLRA